jgi:predicted kinase
MMSSKAPTLHLICGLPGSGKSTLAAELEKKHRALRFNPDSWLMRIVGDPYNENARSAVEAIQWELAQKSLSLGHDAILEFGFWSRAERDEYRVVAKKLGTQCRLYYLDVPLDELKRRIEHRNHDLGPEEFFVDPNALNEWAKSFEPPTAEELGAR